MFIINALRWVLIPTVILQKEVTICSKSSITFYEISIEFLCFSFTIAWDRDKEG